MISITIPSNMKSCLARSLKRIQPFLKSFNANADSGAKTKIQFLAGSIDDGTLVACLTCLKTTHLRSALSEASRGIASLKPVDWLKCSLWEQTEPAPRKDRLIDVYCCLSCGTMNELVYACADGDIIPRASLKISTLTLQDKTRPVVDLLSSHLVSSVCAIVVDFLPLFGEFDDSGFEPHKPVCRLRNFGPNDNKDWAWWKTGHVCRKFDSDYSKDANLSCIEDGDDLLQILDTFYIWMRGWIRLFYAPVVQPCGAFCTVFGFDGVQPMSCYVDLE